MMNAFLPALSSPSGLTRGSDVQPLVCEGSNPAPSATQFNPCQTPPPILGSSPRMTMNAEGVSL